MCLQRTKYVGSWLEKEHGEKTAASVYKINDNCQLTVITLLSQWLQGNNNINNSHCEKEV